MLLNYYNAIWKLEMIIFKRKCRLILNLSFITILLYITKTSYIVVNLKSHYNYLILYPHVTQTFSSLQKCLLPVFIKINQLVLLCNIIEKWFIWNICWIYNSLKNCFFFFEGVISLLDPWLLFYTKGKTFQGFLRDWNMFSDFIFLYLGK